MNKLLLSAALALAASAFAASPASAFFNKYFGLCTSGGCCSHGKCGEFCVRPYNAFSPVACGHITMGYGSWGGHGHGFGHGHDGCLSVNWHGTPCASHYPPVPVYGGGATASPADAVAQQPAARPTVARPVSLTGPARMPIGPQMPPGYPYNPYAVGFYPAPQPYMVPAYPYAGAPAYWPGR